MEIRYRFSLNDKEMELDQVRGVVDELQAVKQQAPAQQHHTHSKSDSTSS